MMAPNLDRFLFFVDRGEAPFGELFRLKRCLGVGERLAESGEVYFISPESFRSRIEAAGCTFLGSIDHDLRRFAPILDDLAPKVAAFDVPTLPVEYVLMLRGMGAILVALDARPGQDDYLDLRINALDNSGSTDFEGLRYWCPDPVWRLGEEQPDPDEPARIVIRLGEPTLSEWPWVVKLAQELERSGLPAAVLAPTPDEKPVEGAGALRIVWPGAGGRSLIHRSRLIVNIGLEGLFDLMALKRPLACLATNRGDLEVLDRVAEKGSVFQIGPRAELTLADIVTRLRDIVGDPEALADQTSLAANLVSPGNAKDLADMINVVSILPWDTDFWGFPVAFLSCPRLNRHLLNKVLKFCDDHQVRLLEYQCDCHDRTSVLLAEGQSFQFTDIRLTFERYLEPGFQAPELAPGLSFGPAGEGDIPRLMDIADGIYLDSRYHFDTNFDRDKVRQFYQDWVRKAVLKTFDDDAFVLRQGDNPVGFCTIKYADEARARIRLVGVDKTLTKRGHASQTVALTLAALARQGVTYVRVTTQGRNYNAQRLYQRLGFLSKKIEFWYHHWFEP